MGISLPTKFLWTAIGVRPSEIHALIQKLDGNRNKQIRIDVDVLPLYYQALHSNMSTPAAARAVIDKMITLAAHGFHVTGVIDGKNRPDCKRVSWKRLADSEFAAINTFFNRKIAQSIVSTLAEDTSGSDTSALEDRIKKLNKESTSFEKQIKKEVPKDLKSLLEDMIFNARRFACKKLDGDISEEIIEAEFQADTMIAHRCISGQSDGCLSIDSDLAVLLGPEHFVIRKIEDALKRKKDIALATCEIAGCGSALLKEIQNTIRRESIKWKEISYPIFDTKSHKLRSYVAMALGCDLWEGIKGVGAAKCFKVLKPYLYDEQKTNEEKEQLFKNFMNNEMKKLHAKEKPHKPDINDNDPVEFDETVIDALSSAFLNEAVIDVTKDPSSPYQYMFGKPESFPEYLSYFRKEGDKDILVAKGPPIHQCNGIPGVTSPHIYLQQEGTFFCHQCSASFCRTCGYVPSKLSNISKKKEVYKNRPHPLCSSCYQTSCIGADYPGNDGNNDGNNNGRFSETLLSMDQMRKALDEINVKVQADALPHEVEELYDMYKNKSVLWEHLAAEFPLHDTSYFDNMMKDVFYMGPIFSPEGFMAGNNSIQDKDIAGIIELFAKLCEYSPSDESIYSTSVPQIIIDFANRSRKSNRLSHKIIKSSMRHATDPRAPPMTFKNCSLLRCKNEDADTHDYSIGVVLQNKVPASMRDMLYNVKTCFTSDTLLCCDCTCKSSGKETFKDDENMSKRDDRITCTHNLPLLYQVAILLHSGGATNFLHDLAARWTHDVEVLYSADRTKYNNIKKDILTLLWCASAHAESCIVTIGKLRNPSYTIEELLEDFQVGTQRVKMATFTPPLQHELIPFRCLPVESVATRAKRMKTGTSDSNNSGEAPSDPNNSGKAPSDSNNSGKASSDSNNSGKASSDSNNNEKKRNASGMNNSNSSDSDSDDEELPELVDRNKSDSESDSESDSDSDDEEPPEMVDRNHSDSDSDDEEPPKMVDRNHSDSDSDSDDKTSNPNSGSSFERKARQVSRKLSAMIESLAFDHDDDDDSSSSDDDDDIGSNTADSVQARQPPYRHHSSRDVDREADLPNQTNGPVDEDNGNHRSNVLEPVSDANAYIVAHHITEEENEMIDSATAENMPGFVQLESFKTLVKPLSTVTDETDLWLTDEIINHIGELIMKKDAEMFPDKRSYIFHSHFMNLLLDTSGEYDYENVRSWSTNFPATNIFDEMRYLAVPINISNAHWSFLLTSFENKCIRYIDSLGSKGGRYTEAMLRYLEDHARDKGLPFDRSEWYTFDLLKDAPQQENTYDCGVVALINTYLYIHGIPLLYGQSDVDECLSRRILALSILKGEALPPITIRRAQNNTPVRERTQETRSQDQPLEEKTTPEKKLDNLRKNVEKKSSITYGLPSYDTYTPDYVRMYQGLNFLYGEQKFPSDLVGYNLVKQRNDKQESTRPLTPQQLKQYVNKKKSAFKLNWRKLEKDSKATADVCHMTNNLKLNKCPKVSMKTKTKGKMRVAKASRPSYSKLTNRSCSFLHCKNTTNNGPFTFERLPVAPKAMSKSDILKKRPRDIGAYYKRDILRKLALKRCGLKEKPRADYRICSAHEKELVTVSKRVERTGRKKDLVFKYTFCVPKSDVFKKNTDPGNSTSREKYTVNTIKNIPHDSNRGLAMFALVASDVIETLRFGDTDSRLSEKVKELLDIEDESIPKKLLMSATMSNETAHERKRKKGGTLRSLDMSDEEVKMRTGFESKKDLLAFIIVVCNGDLLKIMQTRYPGLTWFEEWFLYFEFLWGRSWINQYSLAREYGLNSVRKNSIIDAKLDMILTTRASWPKFCTHDEDLALRSDKWTGIVEESTRVIQHDTTGILLQYKPSLASSQRITWSNYYHGNAVKGNIFLQLGGWVGTDHLWVGGISDTQYMINNNIFEEQHAFANGDRDSEGNILPFTNILDRGYKLSIHAAKNGKQFVRQPVFNNGGRRFTGTETIRSATVASIRSGNERAVRKSKLSGFIKKGVKPSESPTRFDDAWVAWGFQLNFMYKSNA